HQDVVVIEQDPERARLIEEQLDVLTIRGNGASLPVLEEAKIGKADLLLAVTSKDEVNLVSCLAASRMKVRFKVARVSNPEYYRTGSALSREQLGIDLMINPERECAWETFQLLNSEAATDLAQFAEGRLQLVGLRVREGAPVAGKSMVELDEAMGDRPFVTVALMRDGETVVPRGTTRIEAGDQIYILSPAAEMPFIPAMAGYKDFKLRRVMVAGGSDEAVYLAQHLAEHGVDCTILDKDRQRCAELAEMLPKALVLHADATDMELLEMEGIEGIDGFVAYTPRDETNMLASLLAKTQGARKVISLIHRFDYVPLVSKVGIDAAVSPRLSTVNAILRYVRRGNVASVATLKGIDAEAIEFDVRDGTRAAGKKIQELAFPDGAIVGAILRDAQVITPRGRDRIEAGDHVVIFALPEAISEIERLFA
ncbi:MAG: Trk system potassium transporter TrkA, partial [Longimicrobiales bacterium]|nr:Trk system potassium transporter TrkA [Longimicrobiales bacterium]